MPTTDTLPPAITAAAQEAQNHGLGLSVTYWDCGGYSHVMTADLDPGTVRVQHAPFCTNHQLHAGTLQRPVCPDCGPLALNARGEITAHHCPGYSNLPSIDGYPHATEPQEQRPGYWETTGNLRVWQPARHGN